MTYLKNLLTGEAAATIAGFQLCNENYFEALELLRATYGNTQMIINNHLAELLNFDAVTDVNDIQGLRKLYNHIETQIRSLKALGEDFTAFGTVLVPVLMSKIPAEIALIVNRIF